MPSLPFDMPLLMTTLKRGIFALMTPVILLGGIYTGYFSATEAAAVAVGYAMLVEVFIHRELKLRDFYGIAVETSKLFGALFPIVAIALSINLLLTTERVPQDLAEWMTSTVSDKFLSVSYTHLRAHETRGNLVCRLLLEKKKKSLINK